MANTDSLIMTFDPHTIEHLGVKMYSNIPNAIAELIANAYDADAHHVQIKLYDEAGEKRIEVIDDGEGMDFNEINEQFLRIGRKRREEGYTTSPSGQRKVTGRKGIGKLAFFGIGNIIEISTTKRDTGKKVSFTLNWNELISTHGQDYMPEFTIEDCKDSLHGTSIILKELNRKSAFDKNELAISLSKLFNFFDNTFEVTISLNEDEKLKIDDKLKYENIDSQFEWEFPDFVQHVGAEYSEKQEISGKVISTEKPLKQGLRGITLFANGRLVNAPEFYGVSESSHGFSYFTGWLDVDFVDDWSEDVISTDRQSLNWDLPKTSELRSFLKKTMSELERRWREERNENRKEKIKEKTNVDVPTWYKNLPEEILSNIEPVVNSIIEKSEMEDDVQTDVIQRLHSLIPEYPYYHWRHLHPEVQKASKEDYDKADYYRAFIETVKRYINEVRDKSGSTNSSDSSMMGEVFGKSGSKLVVTKKYKKPEGDPFQISTKENIEEGQKFLSMGVVSGGRNPVSHEEITDLRDSGLFTEKDCLDALSLLSHLFRRLEDSENNA
ncbi:MAG: TIGR02391 family protein [Bacteroidales bacterium]